MLDLATPAAREGRKRPSRAAGWGNVALRRWPQLAAVVAACALWQILFATGVLDKNAFASCTGTVRELVRLLGTGPFWQAFSETITAWIFGLLLSIGIGVGLGLVLGSSRVAFLSTRFVIDFLRTVPAIALVPAGLLIYGPTLSMKLLLIVFATTWGMLIQTIYAVRDIDPVLKDAARSYRIKPLTYFTRVLIPAVITFVSPALRLAAVIALLLALAAEVLTSAPGLGTQLTLAQGAGQITTMFAYILAAGLLGALVDVLFQALERRFIPWHASRRDT